jgi:hypothetical protein
MTALDRKRAFPCIHVNGGSWPKLAFSGPARRISTPSTAIPRLLPFRLAGRPSQNGQKPPLRDRELRDSALCVAESHDTAAREWDDPFRVS